MIETGKILQNRYRIDEKIGQGGMGNVYVATDERFKGRVAIKETIFEDAKPRKAFEREARLLNSLKHTARPRVSDHFDEENGQFLVMEFIAGEDLAEMMEKNGEAFPLETVLDWATQLCDALEYLHAQDIIHRDIKPQNLKLTPGGQIVLLDFGLAKGNATDAPHQTAAKSIFGFSRNYASLEQIQGAGTEPRSDLYSLSATLYHLLTGIPPADALTRAMNVLNGKPDPLISANLINNRVPQGVAEVLQRAMALNAAERPESANEMRLMLEESDKFVDENAAQSIAAKSLSADFLTQETKIMGAKTDSPNAESEVLSKVAKAGASENNTYKTNVFSDDAESKKTFVQKSGDTKSPKRAKAFGAVAFGVLLLIGSLFAAGYYLIPNSSQSGASNNETGSGTNNIAEKKPENANVADANISNSNAELAETTNESPTEVADNQSDATRNAARETKKNTQNSRAAVKSDKSKTEDENIVISGETVEMGGVIFDENGIRDKKTGKILTPIPPPRPNIPPEQLRNLTPEQIRKLQQLDKRFENRKNKVIIVKPPTPQPTP